MNQEGQSYVQQPKNKNRGILSNKAWEGNIGEQFKKLRDIDVNEAHQTPLAKLQQQKVQIDEFNSSVTRKAMIRYLTIVVDMSKASLKQDLRPNRAMVTKELLTCFIQQFRDQNPLSRLSIIVTRKEKAQILSDFNDTVQNALYQITEIDQLEGNPSYQNSLEMAKTQIAMSVPAYAHKEILIINCSITICDPDNIHETIESLKLENIVCSVISLSASIHILSQLSKQTHGQFFLAKNKDHFEEILQKYLVPQFNTFEIQKLKGQSDKVDKIKIAFPRIIFSDKEKLCHCHNKFVYQFIECPNCKIYMCLDDQSSLLDTNKQNKNLSNSVGMKSTTDQTFCKTCGILFVSGAKLSRTSQNNERPIKTFERLDAIVQNLGDQNHNSNGNDSLMDMSKNKSQHNSNMNTSMNKSQINYLLKIIHYNQTSFQIKGQLENSYQPNNSPQEQNLKYDYPLLDNTNYLKYSLQCNGCDQKLPLEWIKSPCLANSIQKSPSLSNNQIPMMNPNTQQPIQQQMPFNNGFNSITNDHIVSFDQQNDQQLQSNSLQQDCLMNGNQELNGHGRNVQQGRNDMEIESQNDNRLSNYNELERVTVCVQCNKIFCLQCDIFIHETLLSCPGCAANL